MLPGHKRSGGHDQTTDKCNPLQRTAPYPSGYGIHARSRLLTFVVLWRATHQSNGSFAKAVRLSGSLRAKKNCCGAVGLNVGGNICGLACDDFEAEMPPCTVHCIIWSEINPHAGGRNMCTPKVCCELLSFCRSEDANPGQQKEGAFHKFSHQ